ncbi:hypothetical protein ACU8DI_09340 [Psychroserpens sp. BH13MA-6]
MKQPMISQFYLKPKNTVDIHIFKTNIRTELEADHVIKILNVMTGIRQITIDLEDIDKVLRVEANNNLNKRDIIAQVAFQGFICKELL